MPTQHRQLQLLLILLVPVTLGACFPATSTVVPRVSGRVVDATGTPIAGATVRIEWADSRDEAPRQVGTDRRGRFERGEERKLFLAAPVATHAIGPEFIVTAWHEGRQSAPKRFGGELLKQQFFGVTNPSAAHDLGDLVIYDRGSSR